MRLLPILLVFLPLWAFSQSTIHTTVIDGTSKEPLISVTVYTDDLSFNGLTDIDGKIAISDLSHRDEVNFSYVGYAAIKIPIFKIRQQNGIVSLFPDNTIEEVVVIGRTDAGEEELPYVVDRISAEKIASRNSQTTADVLGEHADVYIQKSQMGGGSPIVRGFEANKVLLVLDGIRMNNAIYRNGHLQNAITVDGSMLEQVEVIYGPGSLMYGSEALGGVVHFRSRDPKVVFNGNENNSELRAFTRFSSANIEKTIHLDYEFGGRKWASLTSMSFSDFEDLNSGSKRPDAYPDFGKKLHYVVRKEEDQTQPNLNYPNVQRGTGYSQVDFMQKLRFQPKDDLYFIGNFQYSSSSNVPRYDALLDTLGAANELKWGEWYYGPQKRMLASLKMKAFAPKLLYDKATLIGAFQFIEEDRLKRRRSKNWRTFNLEDVLVYSFTLDFDKNLNQKGSHILTYGLDANYNQVFSEAGQIHIKTGKVRRNTFTRYPSDYSTMLTYAGYLNYRWKGFDSLVVFNAGLRYSNVDLFVKYKQSDLDRIQWPEEYVTDGVKSSNNDLTWGAGLTINTPSKWQLQLLASKAFRSPNIDDFAKMRVQGGQAVLPNTNLGPETSLSGEATLAKTVGHDKSTSFKLSATGFYTILEDVIVRLAGTAPNGDSLIWVPAEEEYFDVQQNFNVDNGFIYGLSGNVLLKIGKQWRLSSSLSYTKGRIEYVRGAIDTLLPMAHIPPIYGQTALSFTHKKFKIEAVAKYNGKKPIEDYAVNNIILQENGELDIDLDGTPDNPELGIAYKRGNEIIYEGTYAWTTYNLYGSYQFNRKFSIDLGLENITDQHYRLFASGVSAPGRNFIVTLRGTF